jgi:threonine dehydrogenase-like Zn-dependent dehydrogenase
MKELTLVGSCRSLGAFAPCIDMIARGKLDTETLLGGIMPLERFGVAQGLVSAEKERLF